MTHNIVSVLTAVLVVLVATHARADTRVTVHDFYGPNADRVRDDVVNLLERQSGVTIISKGQLENTAAKLGVDALSPQGFIALGRELQLSAWMSGVVQKRAGKLKLTVVVFDGAQHLLVGRTRLIGRNAGKLSAEIKGHLWRQSRRAIMHASAPNSSDKHGIANDSVGAKNVTEAATASPSTDVEAVPGVPQPAPDNVHGAEATPRKEQLPSDNLHDAGVAEAVRREGQGESLRAFIGFGSPYRSFAYTSPISSSLGDYRLSGAPMVDINVALYPARPFTNGWPAWFGLDLRGQISLGTPTVDRDGNQFTSRYGAYHVGLRARMPIGKQYVSAFSGYAMNGLAISAKNKTVSSSAPNVDYRMIRSGVGAEFALSDSFMLGLDAAWLQFLSVGDLGRWFPRATAGGLEVAMLATFSLTPDIFARACASYQRSFFDFNARPGDAYLARGATDELLAVTLGAGVQL